MAVSSRWCCYPPLSPNTDNLSAVPLSTTYAVRICLCTYSGLIFSVFISHYLSQLIAFYNAHTLDYVSLIIPTLSGALRTLHPLRLFISLPMLIGLMLVCLHLSVSPVVLSHHPNCPLITASWSQQSTPFAVSIFIPFGWRCPSAPLQMYCHPFGVPYLYRVRFPSVAVAKIRLKIYAKQIFSVN